MDSKFSNLIFSLRSIDVDRLFVHNKIKEILNAHKISVIKEYSKDFIDIFSICEKHIKIEYKNLVMPKKTLINYLDMYAYIKLKGKKLGRPFTLGNQVNDCLDNGLDITIKPNGEIIFYGIDSEK